MWLSQSAAGGRRHESRDVVSGLAWTPPALSRRMDLELLSKPEQNLQSRLTATQALPFHSESAVKRARYVLRVQSNAARNTAVAGQLVRMQHLLKMWLECAVTRFSRSCS